jgi:EAL domain-containing protein (putative c-di-GMP-specific phosphodiesterase class I)
MASMQLAAARNAAAGKSVSPLCFLMDEDFVFRRDIAKELRRAGIDAVEVSNSARFADMVDQQNPDIVFINLNAAAPHECIRALSGLKDCGYRGAVQLLGRCEAKTLDSFNTIGADWDLSMLPALQKPIQAASIRRIVLERNLGTAATAETSSISLGEALAKDLVKFRYQPKFDLQTNTMIGAEVVARIAHPARGLLTPDQFLKGADEEALVNLTRLALVSALRTSAHFHELGVGLQLSINANIDDLSKLPIADLVLMHRPESGDWTGLILEIPERQVSNKIDLLKARLPKLQQSGVSIAIDNFGRGPSSLGMFNEIAVAEVKIDRALADGCAGNNGKANVCKTIVQMAHNFGARAVAVGISADADQRKLVEFGCDSGQGFLFGEPMSKKQIDELIAAYKNRTS